MKSFFKIDDSEGREIRVDLSMLESYVQTSEDHCTLRFSSGREWKLKTREQVKDFLLALTRFPEG